MFPTCKVSKFGQVLHAQCRHHSSSSTCMCDCHDRKAVCFVAARNDRAWHGLCRLSGSPAAGCQVRSALCQQCCWPHWHLLRAHCLQCCWQSPQLPGRPAQCPSSHCRYRQEHRQHGALDGVQALSAWRLHPTTLTQPKANVLKTWLKASVTNQRLVMQTLSV